jgi:hypothetical protein
MRYDNLFPFYFRQVARLCFRLKYVIRLRGVEIIVPLGLIFNFGLYRECLVGVPKVRSLIVDARCDSEEAV